MNLKKFSFAFVFLFFLNSVLFGQTDTQVSKNNLIPPSPTSSSLAKYAEWPISLYTGTPQVDIPLYTLSSKSVSLPISLSYHASGHRVDDYASWVGLGWSLNSGGVITRTVRGLPDDQSSHGYFATRTLLRNPDRGYDNIENWTIFHNQALGMLDSQPDVYMFSAMGRSFKFFIDSNFNVQSIPKNSVKITVPGGADLPFMTGIQWIAQFEDGTKLYFGGAGATESTENFSNYVSADYYYGTGFISSWYLKKIVPVSGGDINFYYDSEEYMTNNTLSVTDYKRTTPTITRPQERNDSYSHIKGVRLSRIESDNVLVKFVKKSSQRKDLANSYALDSIKVYELQLPVRKLVKQYVIGYDDEGSSRLRLDHVKEVAPDNTESRKQWSFLYSPIQLPQRGSFSQDHWGYYNGVNNLTLLPYVEGLDASDEWGDRESHFPASSAEMLTQINYPTGGNSKFIYEPHSYKIQTTDAGIVAANVELLTSDPVRTEKVVSFNKNSAAQAVLNYRLVRDPNENDPVYVKITITNTDTGESFDRLPSIDGTYKENLYLAKGNYTLKVFSPDMGNTFCTVTLSWMSEGVSHLVDRLVGGVRIKEILDFDGKSTLKKSYVYEDAFCASPLMNKDYKYPVKILTIEPCMPPIGGTYVNVLSIYWARSSYSPSIPGTTSGGPIGYGKVKVLHGENGMNGTEENTFSTTPRDVISHQFPFPPPTSFDYKRGLLMNQKVKNSLGAVITSTTNTYDFIPNYIQHAYNAGFSIYNKCFLPSSGLNVPQRSEVIFARFADYSEWVQKTSQVDSTYDAMGNANVIRKDYYYDNPVHRQLTRTQTSTSTGKIITELSIFPDDYAEGPTFLTEMKLNHQIGLPIEQVVYQENAGGLKIISGKVTEYKEGGKALISKIYSLDLAGPLELASFKFSSRAPGLRPYEQAPNLYAKDSRYREVLNYNTYDVKGNPLTITPKDGVPVSYQWGYNYQYPIAESQNATTVEFYFQGFEDGGGIQGLAHTGSRYSTSTTVNWVKPNNRNYLINYWYRSGGVWKLQNDQVYIGNSFTLSGGDAYDDIRIFPADAQLKTYTYRPLIGMSSMTDQKGQTIYYEYDAFQRLKNVKDQQLNIIQNYAYHHILDVQLNPFVFFNDAMGKTFYKVCPDGQEASFRYNVEASKYSSTVDKEDANRMALDDLNSNGQIAANAQPCISSCVGNDKKLVNGICENGIRVNTDSRYISNKKYSCTFYFEWSDGSRSADFSEFTTAPCAID